MRRPTSRAKPARLLAWIIWVPIAVIAIAAGSSSHPTARATPSLSIPTPTMTAVASALPPPTYQVRAGDGWFKIASDHRVAMPDLLAANNATLDTVIHPGQRLFLPEAAAHAPAPAQALSIQAAPVAGARSGAASPDYGTGASGYGAISPRTGLPRTEYVHEDKTHAVLQAKATRVARSTMGSRQKAPTSFDEHLSPAVSMVELRAVA